MLVLGAAIDLSFLTPTVRKMCSFKLSFFLRTGRDWNQLLPDMPRLSSLEKCQNDLSFFIFFILLIIACYFYLYSFKVVGPLPNRLLPN